MTSAAKALAEMSKMNQPPAQLILDLPHRAATGAADFLVSGANAAATEMIDSWPNWFHPSALLAGPLASGKSHLGRVWQARSQARVVAARELNDVTVTLFQQSPARPMLIEDIDRGIASERVLFHLLNQSREHGRHLLLTSSLAPGELSVALPDLRSRLRSLPVMTISEPDDALLGAVLVKLFADRQLAVDPSVIAYLIRHMDRSFAAARSAVAAIDTLALARQRKVTRAIAAEALAAAAGDSRDAGG